MPVGHFYLHCCLAQLWAGEKGLCTNACEIVSDAKSVGNRIPVPQVASSTLGRWLHELLEDVLVKVSSICLATMLVFQPQKLARGGASFDCRARAASKMTPT